MIEHLVNNIEDLEAASGGSLITPTQLGMTRVAGSIAASQIDNVALTRGRFSGDVRLVGPLSETGLTIGVLLSGLDVTVCGKPVLPGGIAVFPASFEHDASYLGGADYLLFSVEEKRLHNLAEANGIRLRENLFKQAAVFEPPLHRRMALEAKMRRACRRLLSDTDFFNHALAEKQMAEDLALDLLHCFASTEHAQFDRIQTVPKSNRLVAKTEEWFKKRGQKLYSVDIICDELGYSRRSFYRAFRAETGMSPAQYLKLYRLSRARVNLAHSIAKKTTVSKIASEWGFWDHGRFSSQYKSLFGEYPSETLSK